MLELGLKIHNATGAQIAAMAADTAQDAIMVDVMGYEIGPEANANPTINNGLQFAISNDSSFALWLS